MTVLHAAHDRDWPDVGDLGCCYGSAVYGPARCTCWVPVYDQQQLPPRTDEPSGVMPAMCSTCAFRPGSPERTGYAKAMHGAEDLDRLVAERQPFWCHDGLLAPVAYLHPPTMSWLVLTDDQQFHPPQQRDAWGVPTPYRVDGSPGDLCGGWAARVLHGMQRQLPARQPETVRPSR